MILNHQKVSIRDDEAVNHDEAVTTQIMMNVKNLFLKTLKNQWMKLKKLTKQVCLQMNKRMTIVFQL